jgi:hypothetical protein
MIRRDVQRVLDELTAGTEQLVRLEEEMRLDARRGVEQLSGGELEKLIRYPRKLNNMLKMVRTAISFYSSAAEYFGEQPIDPATEKALDKALGSYLAELNKSIAPAKGRKAAKRRGRPPMSDETKQLRREAIAALMHESGLNSKLAAHRVRKHFKARRLTG